MVISWERVVEREDWREWDESDIDPASSATSVSSPSESAGSSTKSSSGIEVGNECWEPRVVRGRTLNHDEASFIRLVSCGSDVWASHSSNFLTTQGFCVQRNLEKYALQAWMLVNDWP